MEKKSGKGGNKAGITLYDNVCFLVEFVIQTVIKIVNVKFELL